MALHDEIKEQQQKMKDKSFKEKLGYFWEYYRVHTIVGLFVAIVLIWILHDVLTAKPYAVYATLINDQLPEAAEIWQQDFARYAEVDTKKEEVYLDATTRLNLANTSSSSDYYSAQKMMAVIVSGDLDVLIADPDVFDNYASNDIFLDLRTVLPEDFLAEIQDHLYYVDLDVVQADTDAEVVYENTDTQAPVGMLPQAASSLLPEADFLAPDPTQMSNPVPVGIIYTNGGTLDKAPDYDGTVAIGGIPASSKRLPVATKLLQYFYE